jgi:hypothetical protein
LIRLKRERRLNWGLPRRSSLAQVFCRRSVALLGAQHEQRRRAAFAEATELLPRSRAARQRFAPRGALPERERPLSNPGEMRPLLRPPEFTRRAA